jgi:hypothetical protein
MRGTSLSLLVAGTLLAAGWLSSAAAQTTTTTTGQAVDPDSSLAEAARKARADKKTEPQSAKKVWTDDNIPKEPHEIPTPAAIEGGGSDGGQGGAAPTQGATSPIGAMQAAKGAVAAEQGAEAGANATDDPKKAAELEAKWRARFAAAYKKLDDDQKDADLMQREYNLKRQQYYSDPNTAMREQYQYPSGRGGELNDMSKKIDETKAKIDQDKQAISDLEDELRKEGLPPGWARP